MLPRIRQSTPLILGALCGLIGERSGIINIGIEGQMLMARLHRLSGQCLPRPDTAPWIALPLAVLAGILIGALMGALLGLDVRYA